MSKEELIHDNDRLVAEVSRLKVGLDEVHEMFVNLEKTFVESKASFTLSRYGELKDMIKKVTSDEMMKKVQSLTENQADGQKGGGLLQSAKNFSEEGGAAKGGDKSPPHKSSGLSGFFKKIKDVTGFSDDPMDIRCLDKDDIRRDNERKRREIQRLNTRGLRAFNRLEQLKHRYQASKAHVPTTRYQELKDMIKDVVSNQA
ncbi:uncharacterized protein LOC143291819 [Babylonia areolata]|uniref:uncharacterized protein LOC143291819 n=1 Tax=Babylonia areolata TaxID=304850 RepID=UPI003FD1A2CF